MHAIILILSVLGGDCVGTCQGRQVFRLSDNNLYFEQTGHYVALNAVQKQAVIPVVKQVFEKTYVAPVFSYSAHPDGQIAQQLLEELRAFREQDAIRDARLDEQSRQVTNFMLQTGAAPGGLFAAQSAPPAISGLALFRQHCVSCHRPKGAAEKHGDFSALTARQATKSLSRVAKREMPPAPHPPLTEDEFVAIVDYLESVGDSK